MLVAVANPSRLLRGGALTVADFADIPGCEWIGWVDGLLTISFDRDLSAAEQRAVVNRAMSLNANEEQIRAAIRQAHGNNLDFLANTSPTSADIVAQVRALTRQNNGEFRLLLADLSGTN
jgi:hypothetical protein